MVSPVSCAYTALHDTEALCFHLVWNYNFTSSSRVLFPLKLQDFQPRKLHCKCSLILSAPSSSYHLIYFFNFFGGRGRRETGVEEAVIFWSHQFIIGLEESNLYTDINTMVEYQRWQLTVPGWFPGSFPHPASLIPPRDGRTHHREGEREKKIRESKTTTGNPHFLLCGYPQTSVQSVCLWVKHMIVYMCCAVRIHVTLGCDCWSVHKLTLHNADWLDC